MNVLKGQFRGFLKGGDIMQEFSALNMTENAVTAIQKMQKSIESTASSFSGTAFPTENLQVGMLCMRTDLNNNIYKLTAVNPSKWEQVGVAAQTASKLESKRTIKLTGKAVGSTTTDLSGDVSIEVKEVTADTAKTADSATNATNADNAKKAVSATKAELDWAGNRITDTYAKKTDIPAAITVDSALSSTSTNPVQNKVIKTALDDVGTAEKVDSQGTNWIRYKSGLQMCWESSIYTDSVWSFPVAFLTTPALQISSIVGYSTVSMVSASNTSVALKGLNRHDDAIESSVFAIGRWK